MFSFILLIFFSHWCFLLLPEQLRESARHDDTCTEPLDLAEVVSEHVVGVNDRKEFASRCDDSEEVAIEKADCQEYEHLANGSGQSPDHALG